MTNRQRVSELAEIGAGLIGVQLGLSSTSAEDALQHLWALGYCFGAFEAFMQRAKLDQYTEGLGLLLLGFQKVLGVDALDGDTDGADKLGLALDKQNDATLVAGRNIGGSEFFAWLADREKTPVGLWIWLREHKISSHCVPLEKQRAARRPPCRSPTGTAATRPPTPPRPGR